MTTYHLSHIDLDGYGCQYLTTNALENVVCYNANYGNEITAILQVIIDKAVASQTPSSLLITDLNLTPKEARWIDSLCQKHNIALTLIDHHGTGEESAKLYSWYHLDTTQCATKLTYAWLQEQGFDKNDSYKEIVEAINAIDIWVEESNYFEFGKVMLGMIAGAKEINRILFPQLDASYRISLITNASKLLNESQAHIELDDKVHSFKKQFFMQDKNDTKDNLVAYYMVKVLTQIKEELTLTYGKHKVLLGFNIGNSSLIGNAFLLENEDYGFYMDVNSRGGFSLRSNNKVDVSVVAKKIGNGGGHPNASGGRMDNFNEQYDYKKAKELVEERFNAANYQEEKPFDSPFAALKS